MSTLWKTFCQRIAAFRRAQAGNVAMTFALALIPIIGAVGAAVDYSRANSVKASLQTALDATALMLSRDAASLSSTDLQTKASNYFHAMFVRTDVKNVTVSASYTTTGGSAVTVDGSASMPTDIMNILGYNAMTVSGSSTVKWGMSRLRVALVLDNTGSMAEDGKMTALKSATHSLLTQLSSAVTTNGDVYVSIVPFVKDVNLGGANNKANWIYWGDKTQDPNQTDNSSWDANNGTCTSYDGKGTPNDRATCVSGGGKWKAAKHSTWNGCVMDRGYPRSPSALSGKSGPDTTNDYDTNVGSTDTTKMSSLYAAEQYDSCPQAAMELSYDWTSMNQLVDNMSPAGNTNQAIGLQLGWLSLAGGGPFAVPAMDPNYKYTQVIILLTDGLNTEDRWYTNQSSIDTRQQKTCANIKAAGITLYTIQVNTGGDPTSTLLQNCASNKSGTTDHFYMLTSASAIITAFNEIGTSLTQLRVAK